MYFSPGKQALAGWHGSKAALYADPQGGFLLVEYFS
jgi:hypothetical protein